MLGWATRVNLRAAHTPRVCRIRCSPKGPKLGFEYLPTYKTLHCVHSIPLRSISDGPASKYKIGQNAQKDGLMQLI